MTELRETGNFGGQDNWFIGQVKNLPPQESDNIQEYLENKITPLHSFKSDVLGFTPIDSSEPDSQI